jgi:hypothetical protein
MPGFSERGIGIDQSDYRRVFDELVQLDNPQRDRQTLRPATQAILQNPRDAAISAASLLEPGRFA